MKTLNNNIKETQKAYIPADYCWSGQPIGEYPTGTILSIKSAPVCYRVGIGCMKKVKDFFKFIYLYDEDEHEKLLEVEVLGDVDERDGRLFTNKVKILGFVDEEILDDAYSEYEANCSHEDYHAITLFDKMEDWKNSTAYDTLERMMSYWNPQDIWSFWRRHKAKQARYIFNLPNFDPEIFKNITGVDVNYLSWIDISRMFRPLFPYREAVADPDFTYKDEFGKVIFDEKTLSKEKRQQVRQIIEAGERNGDCEEDIDAEIFKVLTWEDFHLPWRNDFEPELFTLDKEEYKQKTGEDAFGYECRECGCVFYGRYHSKYTIDKVICPVCRDETDSLFIDYKV